MSQKVVVLKQVLETAFEPTEYVIYHGYSMRKKARVLELPQAELEHVQGEEQVALVGVRLSLEVVNGHGYRNHDSRVLIQYLLKS